ncbi:MAG: hypothetical protein KAY24_01085 [Candidatus Eisenbacteria sp.]|nr:hypothetical protein [Candidatus Eisenbacteria bacterium]
MSHSDDSLPIIAALVLAIALCGWLMVRYERELDARTADYTETIRVLQVRDEALREDLIEAVGTVARQSVELTAMRAQPKEGEEVEAIAEGN